MEELAQVLTERLGALPAESSAAEAACLVLTVLAERMELAEKTVDDEAGPWWCRRCRGEKTFPHTWCATIGCDCEECQRPDEPRLRIEIDRRWPD